MCRKTLSTHHLHLARESGATLGFLPPTSRCKGWQRAFSIPPFTLLIVRNKPKTHCSLLLSPLCFLPVGAWDFPALTVTARQDCHRTGWHRTQPFQRFVTHAHSHQGLCSSGGNHTVSHRWREHAAFGLAGLSTVQECLSLFLALEGSKKEQLLPKEWSPWSISSAALQEPSLAVSTYFIGCSQATPVLWSHESVKVIIHLTSPQSAVCFMVLQLIPL